MTSHESAEGDLALPGLSAAVPTAPDDRLIFRLAQLTLLLEIASRDDVRVPTVDRLGFYDFFSANPFVVASGATRQDAEERLTLRLAGFSSQQLSYAATGQRFASRRRRLQHDLSLLLAYGLVQISDNGYGLTELGGELASNLTSAYADGYRQSAQLVLNRLKRLTDRQLLKQVQDWLGQSWLLIDVLDDVAETTAQVNPHLAEGG